LCSGDWSSGPSKFVFLLALTGIPAAKGHINHMAFDIFTSFDTTVSYKNKQIQIIYKKT
jgi:hypothetical protein